MSVPRPRGSSTGSGTSASVSTSTASASASTASAAGPSGSVSGRCAAPRCGHRRDDVGLGVRIRVREVVGLCEGLGLHGGDLQECRC